MIDMFWIERGYSGREALAVLDAANKLGYGYEWSVNPQKERSVPIGSVGWCESWLERRPVPDFYPDFLSEWMHRSWGRIEFGAKQSGGIRWFVKSAAGYKDFPAQIVERNSTYPSNGPLVFSEVVKFVQEWRYYIADGCELTTGWYDGQDENEPAPILEINWPKGFCGAVDFGRLDNGKIALVESHHPYAAGHYGDSHEAYLLWAMEGWKSVVSEFGLKL